MSISLLSLYQLTDKGCDPDTRPSSFTNFPSASSMCSEGFLVKVGGILRSANKTHYTHTQGHIFNQNTYHNWFNETMCCCFLKKKNQVLCLHGKTSICLFGFQNSQACSFFHTFNFAVSRISLLNPLTKRFISAMPLPWHFQSNLPI